MGNAIVTRECNGYACFDKDFGTSRIDDSLSCELVKCPGITKKVNTNIL